MKKTRWALICMLTVALMIAGSGLVAAQEEPERPLIDQEAMKTLMQMADFLAKAKTFSVNFETAYDVLQDTGQKIEFGGTYKLVIDRPNRMQEDILHRDGSRAEFIFDGKKIYIYNAQENIYGMVEKPGTIDQAMEYFTEDLEMRLPLAELFLTSLPQTLEDTVLVLDAVGPNTIAGVSCEHLAARTDTVDFQIWVEQGDKPVPRRIVITYKNAEGEPEYRARFTDWNFAPTVEPDLFTINPPKDAENIPFVAIMEKRIEQNSAVNPEGETTEKPEPEKQKGD